MNNQSTVKNLLRSGDRDGWNRLQIETIGGLEISGARFDQLDFSRFDFTGVKFDSCQFWHCNFEKVQLSRAKFLNCILKFVYFQDVSGDFVKFNSCILDACHILDAELPGANFSHSGGTNLLLSNLQAFRLSWEQGSISSSDVFDSQLVYAKFAGTRFRASSFSACILAGAEFSPGFVPINAFNACEISGAFGIQSFRPPPPGQLLLPFS